MSEKVCITCRRPKAVSTCEVCLEFICHDCERFLDSSTFSYLKKVPEELSYSRYCQVCYDLKVEPALQSYREIMNRAEKLYVFFDTQRMPPPILRRSKEGVKVEECADRDETILRLAFLAAEQNFNAIVETVVVSEKVRNGGYQKKRWQGSAVPAQVDEGKLERFK